MTVEQLIKWLMSEDDSLDEAAARAKAEAMIAETRKEGEESLAKMQEQLKAEQGKAAAFFNDKKKLQEQVAEMQTQLEEIRESGMSDVEKQSAELKKAQKAVLESQARIKELEDQIATAARTHKLDEIAASYRFSEALPQGGGRLFVDQVFGAIDLDDENAIEATRVLFEQTHASVLVAEGAPDGSGDPVVKDGRTVDPKNDEERVAKMSPKERQAWLDKQAR